MPAKLEVVSKPAISAAQQPVDTEQIDTTVAKLKLVGALNKAGVAVQIAQVLTDGHLEDSMTGAPQLTIDLLDRDYALLTSGIFDQTINIELDGVPFRLVEPSVVDVDRLELLFEHKIVASLRQRKSPLKANRATTTRAQFIEMMLREIVAEVPGLTFVCPEVNTKQKVGAKKKTGRSTTAKTLGSTTTRSVRGSGFGLTHLDIRHWDGSTVTLGPSQLANAAIVLQTAQQLGSPAKAVLAVMEACEVEPDKPYGNPPQLPGSGGSAGILQWGGGGTALPSWANDVAAAVTHSLQDPGATGGGGMISLARNNPSWTAGQIAQHEQGSAFPARYDQAQQGAQTVINAFTSAGGFTATGISAAGVQGQYEFSRGQPGQPEDSWTCMQRLASEVNWRIFIAGRTQVYFVTDEDLLAAQATYRITPKTVGVIKATLHIEQGGRTIIRKGRRVPKPSEVILDARVKLWAAPPGAIVELADYGPGDDRWIVNDIQRSLFDADATITMEAPQKPLPEPAASTTSTGSSSVVPLANVPGGLGIPSLNSSNPVDRVYAASQWMDRRNLPYVFGGGHVGSWAAAVRSSGYDCSSAVSVVLYLAGMMPGHSAPIVSGDFAASWGQPGRGSQLTVWATSGHVFIEFYGRPAKRFDTVPGGSGGNGPHLRYTAPGSPGDTWEANGFTAKHFPGL